jgi:hypothetical protein
MSTANRRYAQSTIFSSTVVTAGSATAGYLATLSGAATTCTDGSSTSTSGVGVFLDTATAGNRTRIANGGVIAVTVGTGGATFNAKAIMVNDGFTDAPAANAAGSTVSYIWGTFTETGAAGTTVGMIWEPMERISA